MKKIVFCLSIVCICLTLFIMNRTIEVSSSNVEEHPIVTIYLSNNTQFKVELYPEEAPNTVNNFIYLALSDYYIGTQVNRVIPDYLIQIGDPIGNGKGFPGYYIKSECKYNGVNNRLKHKRGTLSMARGRNFNTEGSQFFVLLEDDWQLDGKFAAFGRVLEGMEQLDTLQDKGVSGEYSLIEPVYIENIEVQNYEACYNPPEILTVQEVMAQND
ncbi:peptidylprolyl isomerase [Niameybacter massiliensis]|uniref:Peptidyl-prolyl cis-trans isomerase n=1 Tax=Holtiella tumoricola TaxID=3018743 RepID=A0AA42DNZ9_9FIRM|nr:peptidylprolyl isomerase [Niameybacter massiliensis]MDA3732417.1 peptidylprolyl isomerase [Holtiella tumoricola]